MRRFSAAVALYVLACLAAIAVIVIRGEGPHPRVVAVYPPNGDRYFPGGPFEITFSQPMDQSSVERAVQVSPGGQGQGAWFGNILNLQPIGDWKPNVTYHITLTGKVTDELGRSLQTPVSFWFRVHHVRRTGFCSVAGVRNVCDRTDPTPRPLTRSPQPVLQYALSPDGSLLAYTRRDASGLPHLFDIGVDGTNPRQLTHGKSYSDSNPSWSPEDNTTINYERRRVFHHGSSIRLGKPHLWSIEFDGSENAPFGG